ncbi:MAG: hypothetical protein WA989_05320 [Henriciella sp.]|uniref:hypothetical protein n=1 Tax=Henriciella sp. TaxID=1968823 RepID=UPI003C72B426
MTPSTLAIASDFVKAGIEKAGVPLTENLEAYLSITFARFIGANLQVDLLTIRISQAMDSNAPADIIRGLADQCLIACAFFEDRLRRNGTIRHYVGLGQMTYDAADLTEQAYGFMPMRDVMAGAVKVQDMDETAALIDRARAGSQTAQSGLADQNVVVGPWGGGSRSGLLWR